jgi:hypothetical protein
VGTPRPDWALSSDDLNKIVRGPSRSGSGIGKNISRGPSLMKHEYLLFVSIRYISCRHGYPGGRSRIPRFG